MAIDKRPQRLRKLVFPLILVSFMTVFFAAWVYFNMIPTQGDLRSLLESADAIEIFRLKDDLPVRWVRSEDPKFWAGLSEKINYKERFWHFSLPPEDSVVIQAFVGSSRHAWEVRGDGAIHIRKAVRWYRMPVEPEFEQQLRGLLQEHGSDLDPEEQRKRYSPSYSPPM